MNFSRKPFYVALTAIDAAALVSLLILPLAWLFNPVEITVVGLRLLRAGWNVRAIVTPAVLIALRLAMALAIRRAGGAPAVGVLGRMVVRKLILAILSTFAFLLIFEGVLRRIDFKVLTAPIVITGRDQRSQDDTRGLLADPVLRWRFNPGAEFRGRKVNQLGYLDREVEEKKPDGMKRVICMGCSCTAQGPRPYSEILHEQLQNAPPSTNRWEAFNMGVHGYSSVLGLKLFQMRGRALAPDVVTLYFGWNDHWQSGYWPDSHGMPLQISSSRAVAVKRLFQRRIVQFLAYTLARQNLPVSIRGKVILKDAQQFGKCLRVPQNEYRTTMTEFVNEIRKAGAIPLLITAPRARTLTPLLVKQGQTTSVEEAIRLHDEYAGIVREVAGATGAPLLDLAGEAAEAETKERLFGDDGIHLTLPGREWVANRIHAKVVAILAAQEIPSEK